MSEGAELTAAYLRRLAEHEVSAAELTAAADASDLLAVGYRDRFLSRPVFIGSDELTELVSDLRTVHGLLESLPDRLFGGSHEAFVRAVGITPVQQKVTARAFDGRLPPLGRADLYRSADGFKLLEFNLTSSLGGFENGDINRAMLSHPLLGGFVAEHDLRFVDTLRSLVATMLATCGDLVRSDRPVVALADWPDSFTSYEPRLRVLATLMGDLGVDAVPCHVGQIRERDGRLAVGEKTIDIIYRFFVVKEIVTEDDAALVEPILRAEERGAVRTFIPIGADTYGSKGALTMLSDDRCRATFSAAELACVDRILPWSRPLGADLVDYAASHRHDLVLKPSLDYGGTGVIPGWTVSAEEWAERVKSLVDSGHIIQRRVRPVAEAFPSRTGTGYEDIFINWGVFFVDAEATGSDGYGGCLLRGTTDPDAGIVSLGSGALVGCVFNSARESE